MKPNAMSASLIFEDGTTFEGVGCGAPQNVDGPVSLFTDPVGYQEALTDPAFAGHILVATMPQIGNYGTTADAMTSTDSHSAGLVVREMCYDPSHHLSETSLPDFLEQNNIVGLDGVDTRAVTRYLMKHPTSRARIECVNETGGDA